MNRLLKHAAAALVLASTAPLLADPPAASTHKRPATTQRSKKLALPSLNIGRAFDWFKGKSSHQSDDAPSDAQRPDEGSPDEEASTTKPQSKPARSTKQAQAAPQEDASPAPEPRQTPSFPARPVGPTIVSTSPATMSTATPAAPAAPAAQPPREAVAIPRPATPPTIAPPAETSKAEPPIPRIVLQVSPTIPKPIVVGTPSENRSEDASPSAAPTPAAVAVRPMAPPAPPRIKTRALVADSMRYGPVARGSRTRLEGAKKSAESIQPDVVKPALTARILPVDDDLVGDDSAGGPECLPLPAEDLAVTRPLRPQVASMAAIFAQRSSSASPVAATASPAAILKAVHTFGAPGPAVAAVPASLLTELKAAAQPAKIQPDAPSPISPPTSSKVAVEAESKPADTSTVQASAISQDDQVAKGEPEKDDVISVSQEQSIVAGAPSPAPTTAPAPSAAAGLEQPRSLRIKVLHGSVARVNASSGHVLLAFDDRSQLTPGTRVQVFRRSFFKRQKVGEVEVVSGQGGEYLARPLGRLKASQVAVEDELVVVPSAP